MPKAVLFDVDGTLIDSNDLHAQCWVETFRRFGVDIPVEQVRGQIGKGGDQLMPALLPAALLEQEGDAIADFRLKLFMRSYLSRVEPFPGVRPLFERIRSEGGLIVLASSGSRDEVDHHVETLGIGDLIVAATTSDDAESSKPAPDIFEAALGTLPETARAGAVVVGDTPYDAQAAGKAGLPTVGLLCGGFPEADLRAAGCVAVFADPAGLLGAFERSPLGAPS